MKKYLLLSLLFGISIFSSQGQSPSIYCTFWDGSSEFLATLNFNNLSVDSIGKIPGSTSFPVAQANGYDSYRNRYYTISNQGLVAIDASTGLPVFTASQYAAGFKHLNYNPTADLLFATRFNGTAEEFFQISPVTFEVVNQGLLDLENPSFAVGFYGTDTFADEVMFYTGGTVGNIKTINMTTGLITRTISKPNYLANVLLATHDPLTDLYYAVGLRNTKIHLLQISKITNSVDTLGIIPGATSIALAGSAIDPVNRKFIFVSNLGITVTALDNPVNTTVIPYPSGVSNVKGFQTNYFAGPIPRPQGSTIRSQFKYVERWLKNGTDIPNSATQDFTPTESGNYSYRIRRPDGTSVVSTEIAFTVTNQKDSFTRKDLRLFQDAVAGKLLLQLPETSPSTVQIYNSNGALLPTHLSGQNEIAIHTLPSGVYQLVVSQGRHQWNARFIRE